MSAYLDLSIEKEGIAQLTMQNTQKHNALDQPMILELEQALHSLKSNPAITLLVLRAKGLHFCAGADLTWMQRSIHASLRENKRDATALSQLFYTLYHFPKPTLVLIQGACFGGGVGLAACCDIAIATSQAQFCFSEVKMGLIPATISPYILAAIGKRHAMRYCLTAESFDAPTAKTIGLIHEYVNQDQLDITRDHFIRQLQKNSPEAMQKTKALLHTVDNKPMTVSLMKKTANLIAKARISTHGQEGISAFLEKRKPNWDHTDHD